jgi:hypothetical protein
MKPFISISPNRKSIVGPDIAALVDPVIAKTIKIITN